MTGKLNIKKLIKDSTIFKNFWDIDSILKLESVSCFFYNNVALNVTFTKIICTIRNFYIFRSN